MLSHSSSDLFFVTRSGPDQFGPKNVITRIGTWPGPGTRNNNRSTLEKDLVLTHDCHGLGRTRGQSVAARIHIFHFQGSVTIDCFKIFLPPLHSRWRMSTQSWWMSPMKRRRAVMIPTNPGSRIASHNVRKLQSPMRNRSICWIRIKMAKM